MKHYISNSIFLFSAILLSLMGFPSAAKAAPTFSLQGRILKPGGGVLEVAGVQFDVRVLSPDASSCILYEETQTKDLTGSGGLFNISLNDGTGTRSDGLPHPFEKTFSNQAPFNVPSAKCGAGAGTVTYTPGANDERTILIYFREPGSAAWEQLPPMTLSHSSFAYEAGDSLKVGGFAASNMCRVVDGSGNPAAATAFTSAQFNELLSVSNGNYTKTSSNGAIGVPVVSGNPATGLTAGQMWYDSTAGQLKYYDGAVKTVGTSGGSVTSVAAGTGLTGGPITTTGTLAVDVGTAVGKIVQVQTGGKLPTLDGSNLTNVTATSIAGTTLNDGNIWIGNGSNVVSAVTPSGDATMTNLGAITVNKIKGTTVSANPTASGQVLKYNGTTSYTPGFIGIADIRSSVAGNAQFIPTNCTASQTLVWQAPSDAMACTTIAVTASNFASQSQNTVLAGPASGGAGAPSFRTIASADLPLTGAAGVYANGGNSFGTSATIGTNDTNSFAIKTNSAARVTVDTAGNVGVGTATPAGILDVQGGTAAANTDGRNITLSAADAGAGNQNGGNIILKPGVRTGTGANGAVLLGYTSAPSWMSPNSIYMTGTLYAGGYTINDAGSIAWGDSSTLLTGRGFGGTGYLSMSTGLTERLRLDGSGNLGIGTTAPASKLHIGVAPTASANYGLLSLGSGAFNGSTAGFFTGNANGTLIAGNAAAGYTGDLANLQIGGVSKFKVDSSGNITSVGSTSSSGNYSTAGNISTTGAGAITSAGGLTVSSGGANVTGGITNNSGGIVGAGNITGVGANLTGAGAMTVAAGGTAQNLTLNSSTSGSVNLGSGNGTSLSVLDGGASTVNYVTMKGAATGAGPTIATAGADSNINLILAPKGSGNVGIGTTSPAGLLHVVTSGATTNQIIQESASGQVSYLQKSTGGAAAGYTQQSIGGIAYFTQSVAGAGWTKTPNSQVVGVMSTSAFDGSSFLETTKIISQVDGTAAPGNIPGRLTFSTSNGTSTNEQMRITSTGNVGIGTTAPTHTLTLGAGGTGAMLYNTVDQTVNYERGGMYWSGNVFNIMAEQGGTGSNRTLRVGTTGKYMNIGNYALSGVLNFDAGSGSANISGFGISGSEVQSSGVFNMQAIIPNIQQTGTASYRGLWISPYEQTLGSGSSYLVDVGTNSATSGSGTHTSKFVVTNSGSVGIGIPSPAVPLEVQALSGGYTSEGGVLVRRNSNQYVTLSESDFSRHLLAGYSPSGNQKNLAVANLVTGGSPTAGLSDIQFVTGQVGGSISTAMVVQGSSGNVGISAGNPVAKLQVGAAPTTSANYPLFALGNGAFDGTTAGFFTGNANGTFVGVNAASGYTGDLANFQIGGVSKYKIDSNGNLTTVGTTSSSGNYSTAGNITTTGAGTITSAGGLTVSSGGANLTGGITNNSGGIVGAGNITGVGANLTGAGAMTVAAGGTAQNLTLSSSTSGSVNLGSGNGTSLSVLDGGAGTVNYLTMKGSATGAAPVLGVAGSDANIHLVLAAKGTGNVGIGTTAPASKFEVSGASSAGTTGFNNISSFTGNGLRITASAVNATDAISYQSGSGGGGAAIEFGRSGGWDTFMAFATNSTSNASTGGLSERMRITEAGNVGIGTTTPGVPLDVVGSIRTSSAMYTGTVADGSGDFFKLNTTYASVWTNSLERMRIDNSGNVGIGTTSPTAPLHVAGTSNNSTALFYNPTTNTQVVIQTPIPTDGGVANSPFVVKNHLGTIVSAIREDGVLYGQTVSTTDNMTAALNQPGATGLGNNLPGVDLSATGNLGWSSTGNYWGQVDTMLSRRTAGVLAVGKTAQGAFDGTLIAGNVGIGTAAPAYNLEVSNPSAASAAVTTSGPGDATFRVSGRTAGNTPVKLLLWGSGGGVGYVGTETSNPLVLETGGAERVRIDTAGNVGIGTTTPGYPLDVAGAIRGTSLFQNGTVTSDKLAGIFGTLNANNAGQSQLVQNQATVVPQQDITGAFYGMIFLPTFASSASNVNSIHGIFSRTDLAATYTGTVTNYNGFAAGDPIISGGSITNTRGFYSNINSGANKYNFYAAGSAQNYFAGKVGIGTATPSSLLTLTGVGATVEINGTGSPGISLTTTANSGRAFYFVNDGNHAYFKNNTDNAGNFVIRSSNNTDVATINYGAPANTFVVNSAGNVGIGSAAPSEKLHVVGNLRVQGSTDCTLGAGAGATNCTSDIRLKEHVQPISNAMAKISAITGVEFDWNGKSLAPGKHSIGVIAQDVQKSFPTAVITNANGYLAVDYAVLVAPLIQATKELNSEIASLQAQNAQMKNENAALKKDLELIKQKLGL